ncbi:MAG: cyclic nucleotide-binding domain-containing protein [Methylococcaceae bacterium]
MTQFTELCSQIEVEETHDSVIFSKGDKGTELFYLLYGEIILQSGGLVVDVVTAESESAKFALAHQIPRKIDAIANGSVRLLRVQAELLNNLLSSVYKEDNSYMIIEEDEDGQDGGKGDWMTTLLRSPIFQRLPPANLQKILFTLAEVNFLPGSLIIEQGAVGDFYYLIKSGQCLISRKPTPNAKVINLARIGYGDTFGEDALLSGMPRNVSVTALTDVTLLRLHKDKFIELIKEPSLTFVAYAEVQAMVKQGATLMDVRSPDEYQEHHLDHSVSVPFFSLRMQVKSLSREKPVIVVCNNGKASEAAAFLLLRHKFKAFILKGGLDAIEEGTPFIAIASKAVEASGLEAGLAIADEASVIVIEDAAGENTPSVSQMVDYEDQMSFLKAENDRLNRFNQQVLGQAKKLLQEKDRLDKRCKLLQAQVEKLTLLINQLKSNG